MEEVLLTLRRLRQNIQLLHSSCLYELDYATPHNPNIVLSDLIERQIELMRYLQELIKNANKDNADMGSAILRVYRTIYKGCACSK